MKNTAGTNISKTPRSYDFPVITDSSDIDELKKLFNEMRVHQIELENSYNRYFELYDLAPVGFVTISENGIINEGNRASALLLGIDQNRLTGKEFIRFVIKEDREIYLLHHKQLFETKTPRTCELRITGTDSTPTWIRFDSVAVHSSSGESVGHTVMIDITMRKKVEEMYLKTDAQYHLLAENTSDMIWIYNMEDDVFEYVSLSFERLTGYTVDEIMHQGLSILMTPDSLMKYKSTLQKMIVRLKQEQMEYYTDIIKFSCRDGTSLWVEVNTKFLYNRITGHLELVGVTRDITERKIAEEKLFESQERYKRIVTGVTDYLYTVKVENGKAVETIHHEGCFAITGYTPEEFKANPGLWIEMVFPEEREMITERFSQILKGKNLPPAEHRINCKDGTVRWISNSAITKCDQGGMLTSYEGVIKDITERKNLENELRLQAHTDPLTGISNRRHFNERVETELRRNLRYPGESVFLMLDIDHFKNINDTFGHAMGDVALQKMVKTCQEILRITDIIGRVGGEEFAILLVRTDIKEGLLIAERLRKGIEDTEIIAEPATRIPLTVSIGVTRHRSVNETLPELMDRSDQALYQAKETGRNRIISIE
jgi:diguanylate cyclase (GGDEF)-like protein/PAS domain S-box-containing protein